MALCLWLIMYALWCGLPTWALAQLPAGMPPGVLRYRAQVVREVHFTWGVQQPVAVFFAQLHQESAWHAAARSRYASGLAQFTPGTARAAQTRFATLQTLCADAAGCPLQPAWAIRALVLWDRFLYQHRNLVQQAEERWGFTLADYNGGPGWINREILYCRQFGTCDPTRYFGEVQWACGRSTPARVPWACAENRQYPAQILYRWRPLYTRWLASG